MRNWLARLFGIEALARYASYHADEQARRKGFPDGWSSDVYDGAAYKALMVTPFGADPRNIFATLVTDGIQPFSDDAKYSVWPLVLTPLNFPPELR